MSPGRLVKLPDWLDDETAAGVFLKGLTAQYLLRSAYSCVRRNHSDPQPPAASVC
jgi:NADPH:quinone reductase-like Zn-dependent oxidoreductase